MAKSRKPSPRAHCSISSDSMSCYTSKTSRRGNNSNKSINGNNGNDSLCFLTPDGLEADPHKTLNALLVLQSFRFRPASTALCFDSAVSDLAVLSP